MDDATVECNCQFVSVNAKTRPLNETLFDLLFPNRTLLATSRITYMNPFFQHTKRNERV